MTNNYRTSAVQAAAADAAKVAHIGNGGPVEGGDIGTRDVEYKPLD